MTFFMTGSVATKLTAKARKGIAKRAREQEGKAISNATATTDAGSEGSAGAKDGVAHDDHDAKVGRSPMQVLATGGIPTVLCALSVYDSTLVPESTLFPAVLGYFACCCGDTLVTQYFSLLLHCRLFRHLPPL